MQFRALLQRSSNLTFYGDVAADIFIFPMFTGALRLNTVAEVKGKTLHGLLRFDQVRKISKLQQNWKLIL